MLEILSILGISIILKPSSGKSSIKTSPKEKEDFA
jgi:hypothetical protein